MCIQWNKIIIYIMYIEKGEIVHESKLWHQQWSLMLSLNCILMLSDIFNSFALSDLVHTHTASPVF